jgi:hypothetical protein
MRWLGTWHAWRTRGRDTMQALEQPLKIAVIGTPAAHYLGLPAGWSVALGAAFLIGWELGMVLCGAFDYRFGILRRQVEIGNAQDPWKMEILAIARRLEAKPPVLTPTPHVPFPVIQNAMEGHPRGLGVANVMEMR